MNEFNDLKLIKLSFCVTLVYHLFNKYIGMGSMNPNKRFAYCVRVLCTRIVYAFCVRVLCTRIVYAYCVRIERFKFKFLGFLLLRLNLQWRKNFTLRKHHVIMICSIAVDSMLQNSKRSVQCSRTIVLLLHFFMLRTVRSDLWILKMTWNSEIRRCTDLHFAYVMR